MLTKDHILRGIMGKDLHEMSKT